MVALASWLTPEETSPDSENRVWDFFGPDADRVGESGPQVVEGDWEKSGRLYDSRRGYVLAQKKKWDKKRCDELASYINNRADSLNSLVGTARSYGEENWDSIRRGAADGLEISAFLGSGELVPLDIDTWSTIGGVGAATTAGMTDLISMYTRIYDPTVSSGRLNSAVLGTGKALRVGGQLAAGAGLVARSDMAREAYQRGDYAIGLHYSATGMLTGVGTSKTLSGTPIGRGITWGAALGSGLEGWLWGLSDQYVTDSMESLNTRFQQNLEYLNTAQSQYKEHCE